MRYLVKYTKESDIKFISHLDLMRTIQRIVRRADLPVEYSKGFNPHMSISIAQPLSVGMYSSGEYLDIVLTKEVSELYIKDKLNENVPKGIKVLEVVKVKTAEGEPKVPQAMALIDAAKYKIIIRFNNTDALEIELKELLKQEKWETIKKSKSGEKEVDIKLMIKEFNFEVEKNELKIETIVSCGSKENLSAELLSNFLREKTTQNINDAFVDIERKEMYVDYKGKLIPLYKYVK